jgi:protein TonB
MRKTGLLVLLLALAAGTAWAQGELAPSTQDGPLTVKPTPPKPDAEGVYRIGNGVKPPVLAHPVLAVPPAEAAGSDRPHVVLVNAVVGTDGAATGLQVIRSSGESYDQAAIEAIKQSRFNPGTVDGAAVPVLICLNVRFVNSAPPIPVVLPRYPGSPLPRATFTGQREPGSSSPRLSSIQPDLRNPSSQDPYRLRPGDKPPVAIFSPSAEFSDEARRMKYGGVVLLSLIVTEEGLPADIQVLRPLDHGLTEKAMDAVWQYKFQPAIRDGVPVAVRITIEINFHLQ